MCGIAGILRAASDASTEIRPLVQRMNAALAHRGPDSEGVWQDASARVALGHRRLAILDLSEAGAQPMRSASGRYMIVFNGEIYNFATIRKKLEAAGDTQWRGHSDTEVLLAAVERWGLAHTLSEVAGMFAFALWDAESSELTLVRDRLGEKPVYYGWVNGSFLFSSELKAFYAHPRWQDEIDREALTLFLRFGYVPAPYSIFQNVRKLPPGHVLSVRNPGERPVPTAYWSATDIAAKKPLQALYTDDEAADELDWLLRKVVAEQMVSDVPLGAFLSGGIDSSTVVALMQAQSARPIKTFTVGFEETAYNEAPQARAVAKHLGTEHVELYVTAADAQRVVSRLPEIFDEPFADASQIPTYLVAQLARQHVTVSLSGDGGDELFCGYNRYQWATVIWGRIGAWPQRQREWLARALQSFSPAQWDSLYQLAEPILPKRWRQRLPGDKLHKLGEIIGADSADGLYLGLLSMWKNPEALVIGGREPTPRVLDSTIAGCSDFRERMMLQDMVNYLPDDILVKLDRTAMAVSLESRVPLLDYRVAEFALSLPLHMKIREGESKWLLRQVLYRYVPRNLIERPKMGFGVPIGQWLRGPLREWAEDLLSVERLRREGYLEADAVRARWREHLSGQRSWQYQLWNVLMFQAWIADTQRQTRVTAA